jgi:hypothetical protein
VVFDIRFVCFYWNRRGGEYQNKPVRFDSTTKMQPREERVLLWQVGTDRRRLILCTSHCRRLARKSILTHIMCAVCHHVQLLPRHCRRWGRAVYISRHCETIVSLLPGAKSRSGPQYAFDDHVQDTNILRIIIITERDGRGMCSFSPACPV